MRWWSQLLKWVLMKWSILGKRWSLIMVGLMMDKREALMYLWVEPWTAAILHFPKMSNMDCGYPGTSPFASFISMYLFTSASIDTMVGHPSMCDLNKLPYLMIHTYAIHSHPKTFNKSNYISLLTSINIFIHTLLSGFSWSLDLALETQWSLQTQANP